MKDLFESVPDYDMLIDGAFHGAANRIAVENPASGATIATVPAGTPAHAEAALGAARRAQPAGAAAVGRLSDLAPLEAAAALYFRLWRAGEGGRARASADFIALLGTGHGAAALTALDRLSALLDAHGRRPLCAHSPACPCLGGDEACLARLVASAAEGDREEAMLFAALMLRADMAPLAVALAEELAVAFRRIALRVTPAKPAGAALH